MLEHLSTEGVQRYRLRVMSPRELLAADDHLAVCDECHDRISKYDGLEAAYTFARTNLQSEEGAAYSHILYEDMAAYVDGELGEATRQTLESHVLLCRECEKDIKALRALKGSLDLDKRFAPETPQAVSRWKAVFPRPANARFLVSAASAAIILLLLFISWILLRGQVASLKSQILIANERIQEQDSTITQMQNQLSTLREEKIAIEQEYKSSQANVSELQMQLAQSSQIRPSTRLTMPPDLRDIELSPYYKQLVSSVLKSRQLSTPFMLKELIEKPRRLMGNSGEGDPFGLISPVGTVIATDRPTLRWKPLDGAVSYTVNIYDSALKEAATSEPLSATEWTVPRSLRRGVIYIWQVRAIKDGKEIRVPSPETPNAKFKVLERAKLNTLERARQRVGDSHLILGILYAEAGLLDEAESELQASVNANIHPAIAEELLRGLKIRRKR